MLQRPPHDVYEHEQLAMALAPLDALALLATTLDHQQVAMCLFDKADRVLYWNETYLKIFPEEADILRFGVPYRETLRRFYEINLPREELALIEEHVQDGLQRYREQSDPFVFQRKDGRWVRNEIQRLPNGNRLHSWRDVTEHGPGANEWPELQDAFATIDVAYVLFDAQGGFVSANKLYSELFPHCLDLNLSGASYREHLRRHAIHMLADKEKKRMAKLIERADIAAELIDKEMTFRRRDGGWLQLEERPTRSGGLISFWYDVTERVEAQTQVLTLQERLSDAVESLDDGFALFDADDRLVICNSRYKELNPLTEDVLVPGVRWADFVRTGLERGQYLEALGREDAWFAERARHHNQADGEVFELQLNNGIWLRVTDLLTRGGGRVGIRADITDLKHSEQRSRTIAESIPVMINAADGEDAGRVLYASPPAADLFGMPLNQLLRMTAADFFADIEQLKALNLKADTTGRLDEVETTLQRHDGSVFPAALTSRRIVYDGRTAYVSTVFDLSERKAAEELLRAKQAADQANRAKSQFLAHMSHELRTPLNAILGYAQILRRDTGVSEKQRDSLDVIHTAGEHLLGLIDGILNLTKIESGKLDINEGIFDLHQFLAGIERIFRSKAEDKQLKFHRYFAHDLPVSVRGDEQKLRQVIFNLLGNAIKFTEQGQVSFSVRPRNQKICFTISDTGRGIAAADLERIFLPFQQAHDSNMTEGTGLGLTISRKMVELLGGMLNVESAFGEGSLFWFAIDLPEAIYQFTGSVADPFSVSASTRRRMSGYRNGQKRVLVVDDNAENRGVLITMLAAVGFLVKEASDGREAITLNETFHPHAVLMDLRMPVMDGFAAIRYLRQAATREELLIIGISASAFVHDRKRSLDAGADVFLAKPFRHEVLLELLTERLNLEPVFENDGGVGERQAQTRIAVVFPGGEVLAELSEFARQGDIKTLVDQANSLAQQNEQFVEFSNYLKKLAKEFKIKKITQFLQAGYGSH